MNTIRLIFTVSLLHGFSCINHLGSFEVVSVRQTNHVPIGDRIIGWDCAPKYREGRNSKALENKVGGFQSWPSLEDAVRDAIAKQPGSNGLANVEVYWVDALSSCLKVIGTPVTKQPGL